MQNNESRLIKATRRTIRAEVTLVVVIVIIFSWSVYALYRLTVGGSESLFGLTFSKSGDQVSSDDAKANRAKSLAAATTMAPRTPERAATEQLIYSLQKPNEQQARHRKRLVQELLAGQQELYKNLIAQRAAQQPQDRISRDDNKSRPINKDQPTGQDVSSIIYNHLTSGRSPTRTQLVRMTTESPAPDYSVNIDLADEQASSDEHTPNESSEDSVEVSTSSPEVDRNTQEPDLTTESAPSEDSAPETDQGGDGEQPESDQADSEQDQDGAGEDGAKADDESLKEAGHAVDEEVDRMTQPSLGIVYQHDKPAFDYQNTIQFDDSPASGSLVSSKQAPATKPGAPGDLIARFAPPQKVEDAGGMKKKSKAADLQVDHGTPIVTSQAIDSARANPKVLREKRKQEVTTDKLQAARDVVQEKPDSTAGDQMRKRRRQKRSTHEAARINSLNEIDQYLSQLKLDQLLGQSSSLQETKQPRREGNLPMLERATSGGRSKETAANPGKFSRRSDYEDEEETGDEMKDRSDSPSYQLTSDDRDLQELIARQKLIDDLRMSQLPAPVTSNRNISDSLMDQQSRTEPQPADTLFSIDHGLLLSPAADEEYSHKSMSKKKKKQAKMKHKKKMTVAMKKGGHKNKKHKKEEKKFMKEKKFKGAKKGKKVAKGKGGQGGKKGKKLYKDKGFKKKGFKNVYHKEEFGQKKSYFDEFRDKDFKKKWKKFDDKYNYAQMKKWQAKDVKGAKKMKDHASKFKKYDKSKWKKKYEKHSAEHKASSKKHKKSEGFR